MLRYISSHLFTYAHVYCVHILMYAQTMFANNKGLLIIVLCLALNMLIYYTLRFYFPYLSLLAQPVNIKRLLHDIFHIGPDISPRFPYQARQRSWRADMGRGLIPGTIWKISCHNLFITYFTLTFSKH